MNIQEIQKYSEITTKLCELYGDGETPNDCKIFEAAHTVRNGECSDDDVLLALTNLFDAIYAEGEIDGCESDLIEVWQKYQSRLVEVD